MIVQNQNCPVCNSEQIENFLKRKDLPIHQHVIFSNEQSAVNAKRGDLELAVCFTCGFIFNQSFDVAQMEYGEQYDNSQTFSKYFESYLTELVNSLVYDKNVKNCNIIEVGCGKGLFLRKLVENKQWKNTGYGFDPSYLGPEVDMNGRLKFQKRFFDSNCVIPKVDIVISRHVIEHISQPVVFLNSIKNSLPDPSSVRFFFETPTVEWIFRNNAFWDFFYEHCSYFTASSLTTSFEMANFKVKSVKHIFNEQYLWLEATIPKEKPVITKKPENIPSLAKQFALTEQESIKKWKMKIMALAEKNKIAVWGAGAKGVTFVNLIDPEQKLIECVIDLNPKKQGAFIPGTGHPIINYTEIPKNNINTAILMNPNYLQETMALLITSDIEINLIH